MYDSDNFGRRHSDDVTYYRSSTNNTNGSQSFEPIPEEEAPYASRRHHSKYTTVSGDSKLDPKYATLDYQPTHASPFVPVDSSHSSGNGLDKQHQRKQSLAESLKSLEATKSILQTERRFSAPLNHQSMMCQPQQDEDFGNIERSASLNMPPILLRNSHTFSLQKRGNGSDTMPLYCPKNGRKNARRKKLWINIEPYIPRYYKPPALFKDRWTRFLVLALTIGSFLFLIVYVLLLFCIVPHLVNSSLDRSTLVVEKVELSGFTMKGFTMALQAELVGLGPFNIHIDKTILYISNGSAAIGKTEMPNQSIYGLFQTPRMEFSSDFTILDARLFRDFVGTMIQSPSMVWHLCSKMDIAISLLPLLKLRGIRFKKIVKLPALNNLKNQKLLECTLPSDNGREIDMFTKIKIINESPFGMKLGKIGFKLFYQGETIGTIGADQLHLLPGENILQLNGLLTTITDAEIISQFFSTHLQGKDTVIQVKGDYAYPKSYQEDGHIVPWLDQAFQGITIEMLLSGIQDFTPIKRLEVEQLAMDLTRPKLEQLQEMPKVDGSQESGTQLVSLGELAAREPVYDAQTGYKASFSIPFGFRMEFLKLSQSISLFTSNDINESAVVSLTYPLGPVSFSPMDSLVRTTLSGKLKILNRVKFCTFLKAVMMDKEVVFWAIGIGSVLVKMPIGHVTISGMPVSEKLTLKGMEGFLSCQPQINGVVITDASNSNVLVVRISLQLENPSLISGNMGKLTMNVYFKETIKVGLACIEDFTLVPGKNVLDSASTLSFPSDEVKAEFFSQYMNGSSIGLSLNHFDSSVPMLLPTLLDYTMNLKMQGIKEDMVILCVLGPAATFLFAPKSRFVVYNPIDLPVTLLGLTDMVISINRQGEKTSDTYAELIGMAKVNIASLNAPFTIPPKSMAEIEEFIPLELSWDFNVLESASSRLLLTPNVLYIHMTGSMLIQIEPNYQISLNYQQNDIPVYFDHWRPPAPYQISKKSESVIFVDP